MNQIVYRGSGPQYPLKHLAINPGKVELSGEERTKLNSLLQERDEMIKAKTIFIEATSYYSRQDYGNGYSYMTMSEDQTTKELASALQRLETLETDRKEIEKIKEGLEKEYKEKLEKEIEARTANYTKLLNRSLIARILNRIPK